MRKRVLVAMSGGVDSSLAAYLLKSEGYEVCGVTMSLGIPDAAEGTGVRCCGSAAIEDAKKVCRSLGIAHYALDFSRLMQDEVIDNFVSQYQCGRTPNPCVRCNQHLKFGKLLDYAKELEFDYFATGHYAKIEENGDRFILRQPKDKKKDQTYFLYCINKDALKSIIFPLADYTKEEVIKIAQDARLPVADRPQSQDICFIPGRDYRSFIKARAKGASPGLIVDTKENILGQHKGICFYTVGQREGLGISAKVPLYVVAIDPEKNRLIVGEKKDLQATGLVAANLNLLVDDFDEEIFARIRYAHQQARCRVFRQGERLRVAFSEQQEAITPGQSVVFYDNDIVLGGGIIETSLTC